MQIQISSCTSHCQGVTQVQQASQTSATIQAVGTAGAQPVTLEAPGARSRPAGTRTQIQIGCLSNCFGTTTANPSTAALTQLVLAQLSSLVPASDSSSVPPSSTGTDQGVTDQFSCQVQDGSAATGQAGRPAAQAQTAVQTSTTVQVVPASLPSTPGSSPGPAAVDQTQQQTWQLQIGCLFYCVDSQQVQQAEQATTTLQLVGGPPGGTAVAVVQQTTWQVQVGCLAWCWNATQLQAASTQSGASAPPSTGPGQVPGPGPVSPVTAGASEPAASTGPDSNSGAPAPEPPAPPAIPALAVRLLGAAHGTGLAILEARSVSAGPAEVRRLSPANGWLPAAAPFRRARMTKLATSPSKAHRASPRRRPAVAPSVGLPSSSPPVVTEASTSGGGAVNPLLLALAGVVCLAVVLGRRAWGGAER